jgi:DNA-binding winged helix-turn-helix (wHTH) protein/tetratricopeptide (TPR) repeat protein
MNAIEPKTERVLYEFEDFRVDPVRRRLLRSGEPVPLTPKAFAILLVLLERRGEVVEKEELIQKVWPDTFVTEANLTQNISSLRKALGERAQDSRLVLTIPGQGYSFVGEVFEMPRPMTGEIHLASLFPGVTETPPFGIPIPDLPAAAPVEPPEAPALAPEAPAPAPAPPAVLVEEETAAEPVPRETEAGPASPAARPPRRVRRWLLGAALLALVLVAGAAFSYLYLKSTAQRQQTAAGTAASSGTAFASTSRPSIALLKLRNLSGRQQDAWLATALPEMLLTELTVGSQLRVIPGENVSRVQRSLGISDTDSPEPEMLRKLHETLGADLLVVGSYTSLGNESGGKIRIDLRILEIPDGNTKASFFEVGTLSDLFDLVPRAGAQLRRSLGWRALSPEQAMATQALRPTRNEAAQPYFQGLERLRANDSIGAIKHLQEAASADPGSALVYSALSEAWADLGYDTRAAEEAEKAVRLAGSLPKDAQLAIQALHSTAKKEWDEAAEIYKSLWTFYPDDLEYGLQLAHSYSMGGRGPQAKAAVAALRKLPPPEGSDPRIDLEEAEIAMRMSDFTTQKAAAERAITKGREMGEAQFEARGLSLKAEAWLLTGNPREATDLFRKAQELYRQAANEPAAKRLVTHLGVALHEQGDLEDAREMYDEALQSAEQTESAVGIALLKANLGLLYQDMGDIPRAEAHLRESHAAFARMGDRVRVTRTLHALATVLLSKGEVAEAEQRLGTVLSLARQTGNRLDEARALDSQGQILARQGSLTEARKRQEQAFKLSQAIANPSQNAALLTTSADVLAHLGDLGRAQRRLEQALEARRKANDRLSIGQILGSLSQIAYEQGDLAVARSHAAEQLRIARESGALQILAQAHQNLGRASLAQGDLPAAQRHLQEARRTARTFRLTLDLMAIQLDFARLALAQGQVGEAARLARAAAGWFQERRLASDEAQALVILAEALRRERRLAEAQEIGGRLRDMAARSEDRLLQIAVLIQTARVDAEAGEVGGAFMQLKKAVEETARSGFVASGFEARLALGSFQLERQDRFAGREVLQSLRQEAEARGFRRIARLAAHTLSAESPRLG